MGDIGIYFLLSVILFVFFIIPIVLTVFNILIFFLKDKIKPKLINISDGLIFVLGPIYTVLYFGLMSFIEWDVPLYTGTGIYNDLRNYTPISFESMPTILLIIAIAIISYALLRVFKEKIPPIPAAFCFSGIFMGIVFYIVYIIQFSKHIWHIETVYLLLFGFDYVLCSIRLVMQTVKTYSENAREKEYKNPIFKFLNNFLIKSSSFLIFSFAMLVPLLIIVIIVMILFGQKPDSIITAFTNTADWTLSQKIPPPRIDYDGHYLCTVAACGDEKVVKPIRAGKRHGQLIVVNRQLLIANAFEDLIKERTPKLHKIVRGIYDKTGLPISKYINTKHRSNIVYFVMKPFEWLFLVVLYTFDKNPENRIAIQYIK